MFGNGEEKFGIFDRWNGMVLKADWIVEGIMNGVATTVAPLKAEAEKSQTPARLVIDKGRLIIIKGNKYYNLLGI